MCTPKIPKPSIPPIQEVVAAPTIADATVARSRRNAENKASSMNGRDIKTSTRGLGEEATTTKKKLLGE